LVRFPRGWGGFAGESKVEELISSDGTGVKKNLPGSGWINFFCSGQVSHLWLEPGFEKFPLKIPKFSIFPRWVKKISLGWPLIDCGSKVCLGRVRAHLYKFQNNS